jgi:flagellar basal body-associated protein FliL
MMGAILIMIMIVMVMLSVMVMMIVMVALKGATSRGEQLCYDTLYHNRQQSRQQSANSRQQRAMSREQKADSSEQRVVIKSKNCE